MGLGWLGYALGLWGYCLVKGYAGNGLLGSLSLKQLVIPSQWPGWPPLVISSGDQKPAATPKVQTGAGSATESGTNAGNLGVLGQTPISASTPSNSLNAPFGSK